MSQQKKVSVRDVMANTYVMVDGVKTVHDGIVLAKEHRVKALVLRSEMTMMSLALS
ncbi:hypothetical protein JCM19239_7554 [Vibrio variabilis]|uniref:Uncharacterized protein n=1 Tax=Vibrio variabilis TaxID=990271 RepID=A0ABQ0J5V9_9VIBR|nr:hypothetical protein JCM19239_7554 [Vibrio variabilis]